LGAINYDVPSWSRGQDVHNFRLVCKDWSVVPASKAIKHPADEEIYATVKAFEVIANSHNQHVKILKSIKEYDWNHCGDENSTHTLSTRPYVMPQLRDETITYTYAERDEDDIVADDTLCELSFVDLFKQYGDIIIDGYVACRQEVSPELERILLDFQPENYTENIYLILEAKKSYPNNALFALGLATFNENSPYAAYNRATYAVARPNPRLLSPYHQGMNQPLHTESQNNSI
jgi:hypothetical protein